MLHTNTDISLYFIRHAESEQNLKPHELGGQSPDTPLTERGHQQAKALADKFAKEGMDFTRIYVSPFLRTMETVRPLIPLCIGKGNIKRVPEIVEFSQGDWEGLDREETYTNDILYRMATTRMDFTPPNGESIRGVQRRATAWLEREVLNNPRLLSGPVNIAIVSHGITIKCFLHYILGFDSTYTWRWQIDNTSVSKFRLNKHGWWPGAVNDTSHLQK